MTGGGIFVGEDGKEEAAISTVFVCGCQGSFQIVANVMSKEEEKKETEGEIVIEPEDLNIDLGEDVVIVFKPDQAFLDLIKDKDDDETVH